MGIVASLFISLSFLSFLPSAPIFSSSPPPPSPVLLCSRKFLNCDEEQVYVNQEVIETYSKEIHSVCGADFSAKLKFEIWTCVCVLLFWKRRSNSIHFRGGFSSTQRKIEVTF